MHEKVLANQYHSFIDEDKPFFFNVSQLALGDGSDSNHLNIMVTSRSLMANCEHDGVFHIDGTYKLTKNRFPMLVFGITSIRGEFHPIAYNITSHEKQSDFVNFFSAISILADEMEVDFDPDYLMMDSSDATYNAAEKVLNCNFFC